MKKTKSKKSHGKRKPIAIKIEKPAAEKGHQILIKRKGHAQLYDERKVYSSCYFACRNAHLEKEESEAICDKVTREITKKVLEARVLSSEDIFRMLVNELKKHNEDASFLYETHRDLC
ncbi:MAG TPA: ATP cone domain-containing protein [Candidatus Nanoarchaeia archaeon]|nr:ATP cone domain-containing protein [Candidatus Nanoarchaeia archaeon]